ncbi:MAG: SPFH domain-containing protein [Bacilli bacterium]|jgi:regulator of protease activity HflC (stomatin/prohibitin superfamily)
MPPILYVLIIVVIAAVILSLCVRIVRQSTAIVVERIGKFHRVYGTGIVFLLPFFDRVAQKVSLKERVADFAPQPVITKDNVTMQIDTVVYFSITDPKLFAYGVERPLNAIENLTATTLRNIIGDLELDETLTSRDTINSKMRAILDEATDPWGIKVNRVELKNILPPRDIQDAMEKQMRAERERREAILRAEGEKKAAILTAEGSKESVILRAEAARQAAVAEAQGKAEALRVVFSAQADAVRMMNEANPSASYITLEGFKALEKLGDGQATKLIIPSEIQNVTGLIASLSEVLSSNKENSASKQAPKK